MKKWVVLLIISLFLFSGIQTSPKGEEKKEEVRGVFVSYIELRKYIRNHSEEEAKKNIDQMIQNIKKMKLNMIVLQVRSHSDAIYPSKTFPTSMHIVKKEGDSSFDVLDYFLKKAHENHILVYAWMNPYRVRGNEDISSISEKSPAYSYIGTDTLYVKNGIYWNPSKKEVRNLIVEGVKEILEYPVDAVLFDDYFYPSNDVDVKDYEEYLKNHEEISLEEYHFQVINDLIKSVYQECQKKKVLFGVSPDGNIENNYLKHFADVKRWVQEKDYVDFIMPQIYYGFYNSTKAFSNVIHEWEEMIQKDDISLYIALAFYKVGMEDAYAKEGRDEWILRDDIMMREVLLSRNLKRYQGFSFFRYDSLFDEGMYTSNHIGEMNHLKKVLN